MEGYFSQGSPLWYWYDSWVVVPSTVLAVTLTLRVIFTPSISGRLTTVLSFLALAGATVGGLVALDRLRVLVLTVDPTRGAALSMACVGAAIVASGYMLYRHRGTPAPKSESTPRPARRGSKKTVRAAAKAAAGMRGGARRVRRA
ncbi:MAG: hypothetical protein FJ317_09180 [SAR202 cluster bacterium]|nr:hypothetical protein [SAR202 cluster bacterium]